MWPYSSCLSHLISWYWLCPPITFLLLKFYPKHYQNLVHDITDYKFNKKNSAKNKYPKLIKVPKNEGLGSGQGCIKYFLSYPNFFKVKLSYRACKLKYIKIRQRHVRYILCLMSFKLFIMSYNFFSYLMSYL